MRTQLTSGSLYEGQFDMTQATTSAVWRSTGGDQTRTAAAGSMVMVTPFYIANAAATGNVTNFAGGSAVILPAGAIVTSVTITSAGTGLMNMGFTPLTGGVGPGQTTTLGTNVPAGLLVAANTAARAVISTGVATGGASLGNVANATNLVVVTSAANANSTGTVSGLIQYVVADTGDENV
jgi:hypothetical protein